MSVSISPSSLQTHCLMHCVNLISPRFCEECANDTRLPSVHWRFDYFCQRFAETWCRRPRCSRDIKLSANPYSASSIHLQVQCFKWIGEVTAGWHSGTGTIRQIISSKANSFSCLVGDFDTIFALCVALLFFELADGLSSASRRVC